VTKDTNLDYLVFAFEREYSSYTLKYGYEGECFAEVFIKTWLKDTDITNFNTIIQYINSKNVKMLKINDNNKEKMDNNAKNDKRDIIEFKDNSYAEKNFVINIDKLNKEHLSFFILGDNYGELIDVDSFGDVKFTQFMNRIENHNIFLYRLYKNNFRYILRVEKIMGMNNVIVFIENENIVENLVNCNLHSIDIEDY
jgi:hypothetical protein